MAEITHFELPIRLSIFVGTFGLVMFWEHYRPDRTWVSSRLRRWWVNLMLATVSTIALRLLLPLAAVGAALWSEAQGYGFLNLWTTGPEFLKYLAALLSLDLVIYWQHRIFHRFDVFWRFHQVHHADPELDVSSGLRFHPLEIILSMMIKMLVVVIIGPPAGAVIVFEAILNAMSLFSHGNFKLADAFESRLRQWLVTPQMHRIHHSKIPGETNSNFGFNLAFWDRLFGSYTAKSKAGDDFPLGLDQWPKIDDHSSLLGVLLMPFRSGEK